MAINLFPWREALLIRKKWRYWLAILLATLTISMIALGGQYYLNHLTRHTQLLNLHLTALIQTHASPDNSKILIQNYQNVQEQVKLIQHIDRSHQLFWQQWQFFQAVPMEIQFNTLAWDGNELEIQAYSSQSEVIGLFIKNLEKSLLFSQITINKLNQEEKTGIIYFALRANSSPAGEP